MKSLRLATLLGAALLLGASAAADESPNPHWRPTLAARRVERTGVPLVTFHGFADGTTATSFQTGRSTWTVFSNGLTASSTDAGPTTFTSLSDGRTATTLRLGPSAVTTFSDGSTATTTRVGNSTFTGTSPGLSASRARATGGYDFPAPRGGPGPPPAPAW